MVPRVPRMVPKVLGMDLRVLGMDPPAHEMGPVRTITGRHRQDSGFWPSCFPAAYCNRGGGGGGDTGGDEGGPQGTGGVVPGVLGVLLLKSQALPRILLTSFVPQYQSPS